MQLAGQETGFLIHLENQASTESDFSRRMFFYFARLHQKYLQRIYPIVIFSFAEPYREESCRYSVEFEDLKVMEFSFFPIQLNRLNWRDFLTQPNPVAAALMAKMRIEPAERPRVKAECLRLLATLRLDPARTRLISGFIDTYLKLNQAETQIFQAEIDRLEEIRQEDVMEIVTSWMLDGARQEAQLLVLRQLTRRLGALPEATQAQVNELPTEQLEQLAEDLLDFTRLPDLETWLAVWQ